MYNRTKRCCLCILLLVAVSLFASCSTEDEASVPDDMGIQKSLEIPIAEPEVLQEPADVQNEAESKEERDPITQTLLDIWFGIENMEGRMTGAICTMDDLHQRQYRELAASTEGWEKVKKFDEPKGKFLTMTGDGGKSVTYWEDTTVICLEADGKTEYYDCGRNIYTELQPWLTRYIFVGFLATTGKDKTVETLLEAIGVSVDFDTLEPLTDEIGNPMGFVLSKEDGTTVEIDADMNVVYVRNFAAEDAGVAAQESREVLVQKVRELLDMGDEYVLTPEYRDSYVSYSLAKDYNGVLNYMESANVTLSDTGCCVTVLRRFNDPPNITQPVVTEQEARAAAMKVEERVTEDWTACLAFERDPKTEECRLAWRFDGETERVYIDAETGEYMFYAAMVGEFELPEAPAEQ